MMEFRALLLERSPCLRIATAAQVDEKDALADEDEEGDTLTPTKRGQTAAAAAAAAAATTLPISSDRRVFRRLTKGDANEVESGGQGARCANKPARKTKTICEGSQSLVN